MQAVIAVAVAAVAEAVWGHQNGSGSEAEAGESKSARRDELVPYSSASFCSTYMTVAGDAHSRAWMVPCRAV